MACKIREGIAYHDTKFLLSIGILKVIFKDLSISSHFAITHSRVNGIAYVKVSPLTLFGTDPITIHFNGHEFEQTLGNSEGQGRLECCSPWGHRESDVT